MDNIFAQAFDSAIRRAIEMAVEPLHLQIDALKTEIETLKTGLQDHRNIDLYASPVVLDVVAEAVGRLDLKAVVKETLSNIDLLAYIDINDAVQDVINNTDLVEYIDTDALASDVRDSLDLEEAVRDALREATVTLSF